MAGSVLAWFARIWELVCQFFYNITLPITSFFSTKRPHAPGLRILDARCNRVKLHIKPDLSSRFNEESYEAEYCQSGPDEAPLDDDTRWHSKGESHLTGRTIGGLQQATDYWFRVRAANRCGNSEWSPKVHARTLLRPVEGGGTGPGYTWLQTPTEVAIVIEVPAGTRGRDVAVTLRAQQLAVRLSAGGGGGGQDAAAVVEGALPHPVASLGNGSFWELSREGDKTVVVVTLEKAKKAAASKAPTWASAFVGHPAVDAQQAEADLGKHWAQRGPGPRPPQSFAEFEAALKGAPLQDDDSDLSIAT